MSKPIEHIVQLTNQQRTSLRAIVQRGKESARKITRARILLKADRQLPHLDIASVLEVAPSTVWRICKLFHEHGLDAALAHKKPKAKKPTRLDGRAEAKLLQLACSTPPEGKSRWTLKLLGERLIQLELVPHVVPETIRKVLKKTNLNLTWLNRGVSRKNKKGPS